MYISMYTYIYVYIYAVYICRKPAGSLVLAAASCDYHPALQVDTFLAHTVSGVRVFCWVLRRVKEP